MAVFLNGTVLLFITLAIGTILGNIKFKNSSIGTGMDLFVGIIVGYFAIRFASSVEAGSALYKSAISLISSNIVTEKISDMALVCFICAVGLITGKKLLVILKKYGVKFIVIAVVVTLVGAAGTVFCTRLFPNIDKHQISGTFTGALTSTTGLSSSLEAAASNSESNLENFMELSEEKQNEIVAVVGQPGENGSFTDDQMTEYKNYVQEQIGIGHTISYPFGVIIVMLGITIIPGLFRIDLEKEMESYRQDFERTSSNNDVQENSNVFFDMAAYFMALMIGCIVGQIKIPLPWIGKISLGSTGGVLLVALALSARGKILGLSFRMNEEVLNVIKDMGVSVLLAVTGLRYGYAVVEAVSGSGIALAICSLAVGFVALLVGFLIGKYIFKINWYILSGAVCGGMTSTPGLGVAMDSTKSDLPAIGYGATYPFAAICMVVFTIIIENLL